MTDEKTNEGTTGQAPQAAGDLGEEFKKLGKQLGEAAKAAWESETSRNIQKEIGEGIEEVIAQLNETSKKIVASQETQKVRAQVGRVVESAKESDIADEVREGFLTGLKELNAQLDKLIARLHPDEDASHGPAEPPTT